MALDWTTLLANDGPVFQHDALISFGDAADEGRALTGEAGIAPLPDTGLLQVAGEDAAEFLHSQLSNSINDMPVDSLRLAGYCNPKGRLFAVFLVLRLDGGFLLLTERRLIPALLKRLRMFVLRAKVQIEDVSDAWAVFGLNGASALEALTEVTGSRDGAPLQLQRAGDLLTAQLPGDGGRTLLLSPADEAAAIWTNISTAVRACGPLAWRLLSIRAGEPVVHEGSSEAFVPQHVNLDLVNGVSFSKGCYPGQEVVARMHFLGRPNRRMYRLTSPVTEPLPAAGDRITTGEGKHAGDVVTAAPGPEGVELLAVLRTEYAGRQDLDCNGLKLGFGELPYPVESADATAGQSD